MTAFKVTIGGGGGGRKKKNYIWLCIWREVNFHFQTFQALHLAARHGDRVLPLYCFDPRHYKGTWHFDLPKTGPHRLKFLLEAVRDLRQTLQKHGRWDRFLFIFLVICTCTVCRGVTKIVKVKQSFILCKKNVNKERRYII